MSHTRCVLPWQSLSVDNMGRSRICCNSNAHYTGEHTVKIRDCTTVAAAMDTPYHREVRDSMLRGERHASCKKCWDMEDSGSRSFRQIWNQLLPQSDTVAPRYLDITLGNKCNLTCRMCNEWNSHLWQIDNKRLGRYTDHGISDTFWFEDPTSRQLLMEAVPSATNMNFLGGEPLIVEEQMDLLQRCLDLGIAERIELSYNTNMTTLRPRQLSLWQRFKRVSLCVSLDGVGAQNDYIRQNSRWADITRNIAMIEANCTNVRMTVHATFGVLNALTLHELVAWSDQQSCFEGRLPWLNVVYFPDNQDPRCLPNSAKAVVQQRLSEVIQGRESDDSYSSYTGALNHMWQTAPDPRHWPHFWEQADEIDRLKHTSIQDNLPELCSYRSCQ